MLVEVPAWVVTVISVAVSAAISGIVGYLIKRSFDKYFKKKDAEEDKEKKDEEELRILREKKIRDERKEDLENILQEKLDPINQKLDVLSGGTLSSLRNDILTCYYRCREKGYRGDWDYTNIHDLYDAYKELHGNSFIDDVMKRFESLPAKEEVPAAKTRAGRATKSGSEKLYRIVPATSSRALVGSKDPKVAVVKKKDNE